MEKKERKHSCDERKAISDFHKCLKVLNPQMKDMDQEVLRGL